MTNAEHRTLDPPAIPTTIVESVLNNNGGANYSIVAIGLALGGDSLKTTY